MRTIEGLVVPYGKVASNRGRRMMFASGSLRWSDPHDVRLLRDHNRAIEIGRMESAVQQYDGLWSAFSVRNRHYQQVAFRLGFSVGCDFIDVEKCDDGLWIVRDAELTEVSLTEHPVWAGVVFYA